MISLVLVLDAFILSFPFENSHLCFSFDYLVAYYLL